MIPTSVVIAIGSNLGDRWMNLRRAVWHLTGILSVVRVSSVYQTEPVDSPANAGLFLNMAIAGVCCEEPEDLLRHLWRIEALLGRRRSVRNAPRPIDLDLILYGSRMQAGRVLELPHPRYRLRDFVLRPLQELALPWVDPSTGRPLERLRADGRVERIGAIYPGHRRSRL